MFNDTLPPEDLSKAIEHPYFFNSELHSGKNDCKVNKHVSFSKESLTNRINRCDHCGNNEFYQGYNCDKIKNIVPLKTENGSCNLIIRLPDLTTSVTDNIKPNDFCIQFVIDSEDHCSSHNAAESVELLINADEFHNNPNKLKNCKVKTNCVEKDCLISCLPTIHVIRTNSRLSDTNQEIKNENKDDLSYSYPNLFDKSSAEYHKLNEKEQNHDNNGTNGTYYDKQSMMEIKPAMLQNNYDNENLKMNFDAKTPEQTSLNISFNLHKLNNTLLPKLPHSKSQYSNVKIADEKEMEKDNVTCLDRPAEPTDTSQTKSYNNVQSKTLTYNTMGKSINVENSHIHKLSPIAETNDSGTSNIAIKQSQIQDAIFLSNDVTLDHPNYSEKHPLTSTHVLSNKISSELKQSNLVDAGCILNNKDNQNNKQTFNQSTLQNQYQDKGHHYIPNYAESTIFSRQDSDHYTIPTKISKPESFFTCIGDMLSRGDGTKVDKIYSCPTNVINNVANDSHLLSLQKRKIKPISFKNLYRSNYKPSWSHCVNQCSKSSYLEKRAPTQVLRKIIQSVSHYLGNRIRTIVHKRLKHNTKVTKQYEENLNKFINKTISFIWKSHKQSIRKIICAPLTRTNTNNEIKQNGCSTAVETNSISKQNCEEICSEICDDEKSISTEDTLVSSCAVSSSFESLEKFDHSTQTQDTIINNNNACLMVTQENFNDKGNQTIQIQETHYNINKTSNTIVHTRSINTHENVMEIQNNFKKVYITTASNTDEMAHYNSGEASISYCDSPSRNTPLQPSLDSKNEITPIPKCRFKGNVKPKPPNEDLSLIEISSLSDSDMATLLVSETISNEIDNTYLDTVAQALSATDILRAISPKSPEISGTLKYLGPVPLKRTIKDVNTISSNWSELTSVPQSFSLMKSELIEIVQALLLSPGFTQRNDFNCKSLSNGSVIHKATSEVDLSLSKTYMRLFRHSSSGALKSKRLRILESTFNIEFKSSRIVVVKKNIRKIRVTIEYCTDSIPAVQKLGKMVCNF